MLGDYAYSDHIITNYKVFFFWGDSFHALDPGIEGTMLQDEKFADVHNLMSWCLNKKVIGVQNPFDWLSSFGWLGVQQAYDVCWCELDVFS